MNPHSLLAEGLALPGTIPTWGWAAAGVIAVALILSVIRLVRAGGKPARDPQRMYRSDQRQRCFGLAGHRCEMSVAGIIRCQRPAEHADHFYPWSKGGATSNRNAVAACGRHNMSKGAKMPTRFQRNMITHRRRRYYPNTAQRKPGQWYR